MPTISLSIRQLEHLVFYIDFLSRTDYKWRKNDLKLFLNLKEQYKRELKKYNKKR